jgi:hypothetical protein
VNTVDETTTDASDMKYNNPSIGCYFDGALGQTYNDIRVLKLALEYGWQDTEALAMVEADDLTEDQQDTLSDTVQDAVDYLNELETRPYMSWQWHDGDFGLYPDIESARDDVGFVSHADSNHTDECDPDDAGYPSEDYRGEWLHVSDHGNCTLYVRGEDGKDVEIWSAV